MTEKVVKRIKLFGRTIELTEKDLEEFRKFSKEHTKGTKCYLAHEQGELCIHEIFWLLKRFNIV